MAQVFCLTLEKANNHAILPILNSTDFDVVEMQSADDVLQTEPQIITIICHKSDAQIIPIIDGLQEQYPDTKLIIIAEHFDLVGAEHCLRVPNRHYLLFEQIDLIPAFIERIKVRNERALELQRQTQQRQQALLKLASNPERDWDTAIAEITRVACQTLNITHVSIWLYDEERTSIICEKIYTLATNDHEQGTVIAAADFPAYFNALDENRIIVANDALTHPATYEFSETYLMPRHIQSMLDAPIRVEGQMIGVVCNECSHHRKWTSDDVHFATAIADLVAHAYESAKRQRIQKALSISQNSALIFQEKLRRLPEISIILSNINDVDALCRKAIELGRNRLGFGRLGLWFRDENAPDKIIGSFGTDEQGNIRDERHIHIHLTPDDPYKQLIDENVPLIVWEDSDIYDHNRKVVGHGWSAAATLWDGDNVIGWLSADNLNSESTPNAQQGELLKLFALTLGNLRTKKRALSALKQSETYLKEAEAIAEMAHFIFDVQSQRFNFSDTIRHIFEVELGANFKLSDFERFFPKDFHRLPKNVERILQTKAPYTFEHELILSDNRVKHLLAITHPILDSEGEVIQIFGIVQDITARKLAEEQRLQLQTEQNRVAMLREFISNATHDVMTPITTMKSSMYVIGKSEKPDEITRHLNIVNNQLQHLQEMFRNMLMVSQLDNMTPDNLTPVDIDLNVDVRYWSAKHQALTKQNRQTLTFKPFASPVRANIDLHYLKLAITHLLDNAIQFTPENGKILLRVQPNENHAEIIISDTGIGIEVAEQKGIFTRFYRSQKHRPTNAGSGLGLTIVKQIVDLHQGELKLDSEPGKGTTFTIRLPQSV